MLRSIAPECLKSLANMPWPRDALKERLKSYEIEQQLHVSDSDGTVDIRKALVRLDKSLPPNRVLISDAGRFVAEVWRAVSVSNPHNFINALNSACLGIGVAHGIGAFCAAQKGQPVLIVCGDGGFMHAGITEFNTAVRYGIDIVVIVCNDKAYGAEYVQFRDRQLDPGLVCFEWPDLASVATSLGGEGVTVRSDDDLEKASEAIRNRKGPILIDLRLDPDRIPPIPY